MTSQPKIAWGQLRRDVTSVIDTLERYATKEVADPALHAKVLDTIVLDGMLDHLNFTCQAVTGDKLGWRERWYVHE